MKLTRLKELRERKLLSQRELAALSGVSRTTLARLESGEDEPQPRTVRKLVAALGVEPAELWESGETGKAAA